MSNAPPLDSQDLECLAWVAEGLASLVPELSADRLLAAGFVRRVDHGMKGSVLELTSSGLSLIRSSDQ